MTPDEEELVVSDSSDVYDSDQRKDLEENDEMSSWEEGFMEGADGDGQRGKCANCGAALTSRNTIEREADDKVTWFCTNECVDDFLDKKDAAAKE